jgi:hypothetical protein
MYKGNKFKSPVGSHYLKAIFFEEAVNVERPDVVYTLKVEDHTYDGVFYPSLHKLYVDFEDPSEYEFCKKYLDGWSHWKKLIECNWFKPYLAAMREELDIKLRARAMNSLRVIAEDPSNKNHYMANKVIFDNGIAPKADNRGRPSKAKIKEEADKMFKANDEVNEDYDRIVRFPVN